MGLIGSYLGTLYCGGSGYYLSPVTFVRRPVCWIEIMSKYKATHTQAPNFAFKLAARKYNELSASKRPTDLDLSSMEHMFNAAEPVTMEALNDFQTTFGPYGLPDGVIVPGYGLAEHTVYVTDRGTQKLKVKRNILKNEHRIELVHDEDDDEKSTQVIIGCGVPTKARGVDVRIVNKTTCEEVKEDCVGEVWVNSPSKANGYYNMEELSQGVFFAKLSASNLLIEGEEEVKIGEGKNHTGDASAATYLRTGDLGFIHNKELFICGRDKDLIIIRGKNHYPQDIEKTVENDNSKIRGGCSAAFSITTSGTGPGNCEEENLIVVAEVRDVKGFKKASGDGCSINDYATELAKRITSDHGVNVYNVLLVKPRSIDKTSSGKIARQWVRKAYLGKKLQIVGESRGNSNESGTAGSGTSGGNGGEHRDNNSGETKTNNNKGDDELDITLKQMIAEHSEGALEPSRINMNEGLITLGLGSMQVVQFSGQISSEFNVELDEELLFQEDTTLNTLKNMILKSQGKEELIVVNNTGEAKGASGKIAPTGKELKDDSVAVHQSRQMTRKKGPSTFQVVFCFCCRGNQQQDQRKQAAINRQAEDDF
jgi:acyl-CoA synthetase (AMP-forming)/AMP-acid ligase II/acyl carrier protein